MESLAALPRSIASLGLGEPLQALTFDKQQLMASPAADFEEAAQQFEGLFLSMMLKEMRSTLAEGGLFGSDSSDTYGAMFDMFLGQHLAKSNPLGLAHALGRYVQNSRNYLEQFRDPE